MSELQTGKWQWSCCDCLLSRIAANKLYNAVNTLRVDLWHETAAALARGRKRCKCNMDFIGEAELSFLAYQAKNTAIWEEVRQLSKAFALQQYLKCFKQSCTQSKMARSDFPGHNFQMHFVLTSMMRLTHDHAALLCRNQRIVLLVYGTPV